MNGESVTSIVKACMVGVATGIITILPAGSHHFHREESVQYNEQIAVTDDHAGCIDKPEILLERPRDSYWDEVDASVVTRSTATAFYPSQKPFYSRRNPQGQLLLPEFNFRIPQMEAYSLRRMNASSKREARKSRHYV